MDGAFIHAHPKPLFPADIIAEAQRQMRVHGPYTFYRVDGSWDVAARLERYPFDWDGVVTITARGERGDIDVTKDVVERILFEWQLRCARDGATCAVDEIDAMSDDVPFLRRVLPSDIERIIAEAEDAAFEERRIADAFDEQIADISRQLRQGAL